MSISIRKQMIPLLLGLALGTAQAGNDRIVAVIRKSTIESTLNAFASTGGFNQGGTEWGVKYAVTLTGFGVELSPEDQKLYLTSTVNIKTEFKTLEFNWGPNYTYRIRVLAAIEGAPAQSGSGSGMKMCVHPEALRETYCQSGSSWLKCQGAAAAEDAIASAMANMACTDLASLGVVLPDLDRTWIVADEAPRIESDKITLGYTIVPRRHRVPCISCLMLLLQ